MTGVGGSKSSCNYGWPSVCFIWYQIQLGHQVCTRSGLVLKHEGFIVNRWNIIPYKMYTSGKMKKNHPTFYTWLLLLGWKKKREHVSDVCLLLRTCWRISTLSITKSLSKNWLSDNFFYCLVQTRTWKKGT